MLYDAPLARTADELRSGRTAARVYVEEIETRANDVEPEIRSLVHEEGRWDRLREEADDLEQRYPDPFDRPPLYGVPIGVKDIFHADGFLTRAGSELPPEVLAGTEAEVVTALEEAGALVLGKTVTTEFAYYHPGPTRNPHDIDRTPGGSSSGSAAAVAAGLCPFAFGTQTIGSIIRPAAFCGVVGYKPSFGRISTEGVIPLSTSLDHVGFFTRDTEGAMLAAALLCDDWRPLPAPNERPVIGVPEGTYLEQASTVGLDAFEDHLDDLDDAGFDIRRVTTFENIEDINHRHDRLVAADAALAHDRWYDEYGDRYAEKSRALVEEGLDVPTSEIASGRRGRIELRNALETSMDEHGLDAWIAPAAPGPPPEGIDSTGDPIMNLPWTHSGLPTICLPASRTADGLPLGVQCASRFGTDEDLFRWSHGIAHAL